MLWPILDGGRPRRAPLVSMWYLVTRAEAPPGLSRPSATGNCVRRSRIAGWVPAGLWLPRRARCALPALQGRWIGGHAALLSALRAAGLLGALHPGGHEAGRPGIGTPNVCRMRT